MVKLIKDHTKFNQFYSKANDQMTRGRVCVENSMTGMTHKHISHQMHRIFHKCDERLALQFDRSASSNLSLTV